MQGDKSNSRLVHKTVCDKIWCVYLHLTVRYVIYSFNMQDDKSNSRLVNKTVCDKIWCVYLYLTVRYHNIQF